MMQFLIDWWNEKKKDLDMQLLQFVSNGLPVVRLVEHMLDIEEG